MALGGVALLLVAALIVVFVVTRGDDDGPDNAAGNDASSPAIRTPSTGGTRGGPEPVLAGPAIKYAPSEEEIGGGIEGVPNESTTITPDMYADPSFGPFKATDEGRQKVREWGYQEGYLGILQPDGLNAGLLEGRYFARVETHLFANVEGASNAYAWYADLYQKAALSEPQDAAPLANQSSGWKIKQGKIDPANVDAAFHRFIFRRGNLVVIVQTTGADTFMTIDPARDIAVIVDERALGNRAAPTPTPSGGALPPTPVPNR